MDYVLIVGAKSDIGLAVARRYASQGFGLHLAARDRQSLEPATRMLRDEFGVDVQTVEFDALAFDQFNDFYHQLEPKPIGVVATVGYLGDQSLAEQNSSEAQRIVGTNFTGLALLLEIVAADLVQRGTGFIVGVSSVSGERGRRSNYFYGSAKAAFTTFLSGLRNRLCKSGVQVLTVQLGFVRSKMTAGMNLPTVLILTADEAAKRIVGAQQRGKDVIYLSAIWWWIMLVVRSLPESIFKRLDW